VVGQEDPRGVPGGMLEPRIDRRDPHHLEVGLGPELTEAEHHRRLAGDDPRHDGGESENGRDDHERQEGEDAAKHGAPEYMRSL